MKRKVTSSLWPFGFVLAYVCVFLLFISVGDLKSGRITIFAAKDALSLLPYHFELYLTQATFLILILYVFDSRPVESINMSIDPPPLRIWSSVINAAFRVFYKSLCNWVSSIFFKFITLITTLFSNEHTFWSRSLYFFSRVFEL